MTTTDEIEMEQTDMRNIPELGLLRLRLGNIQGAVLLEAPSRPDFHGHAVTIATDCHISRMAPYVAALRRAADWLEEMVERERADNPFDDRPRSSVEQLKAKAGQDDTECRLERLERMLAPQLRDAQIRADLASRPHYTNGDC